MIKTHTLYPNGGKIDVYKFIDQTSDDFENVLKCCEYFAAQGAHVIIYPQFSVTIGNIAYEHIFSSLRNTQYWGRCPDFTVNGVWYEHEGFDTKKEISCQKKKLSKYCNMLSRGVKQSDKIIVEDTGVWRQSARRIIHNRIYKEKQNISEVYIRTNSGLETIYKK